MEFRTPCYRRSIFTALLVLIFSTISMTVQAAPPVAVDDVRALPVGSTLTLNVTSNDFDPDGDTILLIALGQPENGTVTQSGNGGTIIYTPNPDFIGTDSFTYQIQEQNPDLLTATATVTVLVTDNAFNAGLVTGNMRSLAESLANACRTVRTLSDAELGDTGRLLLARCNELEQIALNNPSSLQSVLEQIAPDEALTQVRLAVDDSHTQTQAVAKRIEQRRLAISSDSFSINGYAVTPTLQQARGGGASADEASLYSRLGIFASVQLDESEYDKNAFENGYDASSNSVTAGVDYFITTQLLAGAALGYSQQDVSYNHEDGQLDASTVTFLAFLSYQYTAFTFDLQAGYAGGELDMARRVHYSTAGVTLDDQITSGTNSSQFLIHGQAQWEWQRNALTVYPFVTIDWQQTEIDAFGEVGETGFEMDVREQSEEQITLALGVQTTYALNMNWGVLLPTFSLTALSDSLSERNQITGKLAYDTTPDNDYFLDGQDIDTLYYEMSFGASAIFTRGTSGFLQYRQVFDYEHYSAYQLQLGFRQEF